MEDTAADSGDSVVAAQLTNWSLKSRDMEDTVADSVDSAVAVPPTTWLLKSRDTEVFAADLVDSVEVSAADLPKTLLHLANGRSCTT